MLHESATVNVSFSSPIAVVSQGVEVVVRDEAVLAGNTALLTCELPPSLTDLLQVTAWERDRGLHIYPSLHGGRSQYRLPMLLFTSLYLHEMNVSLRNIYQLDEYHQTHSKSYSA